MRETELSSVISEKIFSISCMSMSEPGNDSVDETRKRRIIRSDILYVSILREFGNNELITCICIDNGNKD